jgi:hypothetical protein
MRSGTIKRLFTVDDLYRMDRAGIFRNERVELIHGEVFRVMIGPRHAAAVERARDVFNRSLLGKVAVRSQNPIWIDEYNFPQPDVVVAKYRADYYESEYPRREDWTCRTARLNTIAKLSLLCTRFRSFRSTGSKTFLVKRCSYFGIPKTIVTRHVLHFAAAKQSLRSPSPKYASVSRTFWDSPTAEAGPSRPARTSATSDASARERESHCPRLRVRRRLLRRPVRCRPSARHIAFHLECM